jgi:excinuclease ABC subunit C
MVVDGGRGQLHIAQEVLEELDIQGVALAAIAKDRRRENAAMVRERIRARLEDRLEDHEQIEERGFDSVWLPGRKSGIAVKGAASPLAILARLRDEAHRFAVGYHRSRRTKQTIRSELTDIRGVGPKTVRKLFDGFGSVAALKRASADEIVKKARISRATAERIVEKLK